MDKELENLLYNYEKAIYGQAFPITPSIHQLHLLLDYIANLEQKNQELKSQLEDANEKILLLQASEPMLNYKKALEELEQGSDSNENKIF